MDQSIYNMMKSRMDYVIHWTYWRIGIMDITSQATQEDVKERSVYWYIQVISIIDYVTSTGWSRLHKTSIA